MKKTFFLLSIAFGFMACEKEKNPAEQMACQGLISGDVEEISVFPADNPWNTDISNADIDPRSTAIINFLSQGNPKLKADFGSGLWQGLPMGFPVTVVCGDQPKIPIIFRGNDYDNDYGHESDPGPYPIPLNAQIEGDGDADSHVIVVDVTNQLLYELYNAERKANGWECSSAAKFDLKTNDYRPAGWTSADGAGLPIFPGLVRYDEVKSGVIDHAIRFTLQKAKVSPGYTFPARHLVNGTNVDLNKPTPMGMRLRLKLTDAEIATYSANNQVILRAMKKYGIILADRGSDFYFSGREDERWDNDDLQELKNITASNFEVIKMDNITYQ